MFHLKKFIIKTLVLTFPVSFQMIFLLIIKYKLLISLIKDRPVCHHTVFPRPRRDKSNIITLFGVFTSYCFGIGPSPCAPLLCFTCRRIKLRISLNICSHRQSLFSRQTSARCRQVGWGDSSILWAQTGWSFSCATKQASCLLSVFLERINAFK